jgi:uncharacterized membrane protein
MDKLIKPGRFIFAIGITGLGILCFISKDFIAGRPPVSSFGATIPGKLAWAYVSGSILILAGMAVLFNIKARIASLTVGVMILLCSFLLRHLYEMTDWGNAYKALALTGGAFIVAASFPGEKRGAANNFLTNYTLVFTGCLFFSLFFIICGFLHFKFPDFIKNDFIPRYIPFRGFWTYFCGVCLLAGGVGLIIPQTRKWAALLSGIMILGWFLLLHVVRFIHDTNNVSDRLGLCESFTFVGMLFVLAGITSKKESYQKNLHGT